MLTLVSGGAAVVADDWPGWRGPTGLMDQRGATLVFAAGPKYQHLATNELKETANASIAISNSDLFIRTHKHLWCISEKK